MAEEMRKGKHGKKNDQKMKSYSHFKRSLTFAKLINQYSQERLMSLSFEI